jgi:putative transposase
MDAPSSTFFALASSVPHEKAASPAPKLRQSQYSKPIDTSRAEPADMSDRRGGARLIAGLSPLWPTIRTVIADAGHESRKLAAEIKRHEGWKLLIVKRSDRAFKIVGLNWIVERTFAWLGRNRRLAKDYEYRVQTSETLIDIAAVRLMLSRLATS